jgi:hypothetical protein
MRKAEARCAVVDGSASRESPLKHVKREEAAVGDALTLPEPFPRVGFNSRRLFEALAGVCWEE